MVLNIAENNTQSNCHSHHGKPTMWDLVSIFWGSRRCFHQWHDKQPSLKPLNLSDVSYSTASLDLEPLPSGTSHYLSLEPVNSEANKQVSVVVPHRDINKDPGCHSNQVWISETTTNEPCSWLPIQFHNWQCTLSVQDVSTDTWNIDETASANTSRSWRIWTISHESWVVAQVLSFSLFANKMEEIFCTDVQNLLVTLQVQIITNLFLAQLLLLSAVHGTSEQLGLDSRRLPSRPLIECVRSNPLFASHSAMFNMIVMIYDIHIYTVYMYIIYV